MYDLYELELRTVYKDTTFEELRPLGKADLVFHLHLQVEEKEAYLSKPGLGVVAGGKSF